MFTLIPTRTAGELILKMNLRETTTFLQWQVCYVKMGGNGHTFCNIAILLFQSLTMRPLKHLTYRHKYITAN